MSEIKSSNKDLTLGKRQQILHTPLEQFDDNKLKKRAITDIVNSFNVNRNTVGKLWKQANKLIENGSNFMDVTSRKKMWAKKGEIDMYDVARVPLNRRDTIRSTAAAVSTHKSSLYRNFQCGEIRRYRNAVKHSLALSNMVEREEFYKPNIKDGKTTFHDVMNVIHMIKSGSI